MQDTQNARPDTDHVWRILRDDARTMAGSKPFLAPILNKARLSKASFLEALSRRLTSVLASAELDEDAYRKLLLDGLDRQSANLSAAVQDLDAVNSRDPACQTLLHAFLNYKGFQALRVHRIAHQFWQTGRQGLARWFSNRASATLGPDIHREARIASGIMLDHGSGIVIGETAIVEDYVTIMQNVTLGGTGKELVERHPKLWKGMSICAGASIVRDVDIGALSKIGAGSVVLKAVRDGCIVAGAPARIIRPHPAQDVRRGSAGSNDAAGAAVFFTHTIKGRAGAPSFKQQESKR